MKNVVAMALAMVLFISPPASAKGSYDARIEKAGEDLTAVRKEIGALETKIGAAETTYSRLEGVYSRAATRLSAAKSGASKVRGQIRKLDIKLARMRRVGPLAEAWNKYKNNPTLEQFVDLWTLVEGTPPDNATKDQYDLHAQILHQKILRKGVTGIALALAEVGKLTISLVDILTGEAFKEPAAQMADIFKEYVVDKALEATGASEIFGASTVVKTAAGLSDASGVLGELEDQAQSMADEAYEEAKNALHGLQKGQDLATEIEKAQKARAAAETLLEKKEAQLKPIQSAVDTLKSQLDGAKKYIDDWKEEKGALVSKANHLEEKIADYRILAAQAKALEDLNASRDSSQAGQPYATDVKLHLDHNTLAADELTAGLTGYPQATRFNPTVSKSAVSSAPFTYTVSLTGGKTVEKRGQRRVCQGLGRMPYDAGAGITAFPAVSVDKAKFRIEGKKAGVGTVTASMSGGYGKWVDRKVGETKYQECSKVPRTVASKPVDVTVWEAASVTYDGLDPAEEKSGTIDFFLEGWRNVTIIPRVTLTNGQETSVRGRVPKGLIQAQLTGTHFPISVRDGEVRVSKPSKTGKARLTLRIGGAEGASGVTKTFDLTANSMELGTLPLGVAMKEGYVPLDEPVTCRLAVTGEADMSKYQVAWHNFDPHVEFAQTTEFKRADGQWVSDNVIRFRSQGLELGKNLHDALTVLRNIAQSSRPRAQLIHKASKRKVGLEQALPKLVPVPPKLEKLRIASSKGSWRKIDFFRPDSRSTRNLKIAVMGYFSGGVKLWIPVYYLETSWQGDLAAAGIDFDPDEGLQIPSNNARFGEVGSARLEVGLDQYTANNKRLYLVSDELRDSMDFTSNYLQVVQGGTDSNPTIQAKVYGPANLSNCRVQWYFLGNMKATTGFSKKDGQWVSEIPATGGHSPRRLISVDLLSASGGVLASYRCTQLGKPLPPATMRISMPEKAKAGEKVIVTAVVENVPEANADEYICRWQVDSKYGELMSTETPVYAAGGNQGRSRTTLFLADDFSGQVPVPVAAELFLRLGVGDIE